jgi:hypothetical protein
VPEPLVPALLLALGPNAVEERVFGAEGVLLHDRGQRRDSIRHVRGRRPIGEGRVQQRRSRGQGAAVGIEVGSGVRDARLRRRRCHRRRLAQHRDWLHRSQGQAAFHGDQGRFRGRQHQGRLADG